MASRAPTNKGENLMSATAIKQLTERNMQLEQQRKNNLARVRAEGERFTGLVIAGVSSGVAGYVDGRFDITKSDDKAGDGFRVMGAPVMPVLGLVTGAVGVWMGGKVGNGLVFAGLGIGCGATYDMGRKRGMKDYEKSLTQATAA